MLLLSALLGGCEKGSAPPPPPEQGHGVLLYQGSRGEVPEIMQVVGSTSQPSPLFAAGMQAMDPTPSPDGERIAFVVANYEQSTGDIFVINRDGTGLRQLTYAPELDDSPNWSPDGQQLVFRSYRSGYEGEIWIMNADGSGTMNLTPNPLPGIVDNRRPHWSPDGQRIVYASTLGGDFGIWVMDSVGGGKQQLTFTEDLDAEPVWSPDGQWIAFRRSTADGSDIHLMTADGSASVQFVLGGEQRLPAWSLDGEWLAFVGQTSLNTQPEIYTMRKNGQELKLITSDPAWGGGTHPVWWRAGN